MCKDYEPPDADFIHYHPLKIRGDARQLYNSICEKGQSWHEMIRTMSNRYASNDKQDEVSNRIMHLSIHHFLTPDRD